MSRIFRWTEEFQHFAEEIRESFWGDLYGHAKLAWKAFLEEQSRRERDRYVGVQDYQRAGEKRRGYRNGFYVRDFVTRRGTLHLRLARGRTKEDLKEIRHVYLDLDEGGAHKLEAIRRDDAMPAPNYVLNTSPGKFQVIWRVEGIGQDLAEEMLRSLAQQYGGDPAATDSTRVFRLPGFNNKKYEQDFQVAISPRGAGTSGVQRQRLRHVWPGANPRVWAAGSLFNVPAAVRHCRQNPV